MINSFDFWSRRMIWLQRLLSIAFTFHGKLLPRDITERGDRLMNTRNLCSLVWKFNFLLTVFNVNGMAVDSALNSLTQSWSNKPQSWVGQDPCSSWDGIRCSNTRITQLLVLGFFSFSKLIYMKTYFILSIP